MLKNVQTLYGSRKVANHRSVRSQLELWDIKTISTLFQATTDFSAQTTCLIDIIDIICIFQEKSKITQKTDLSVIFSAIYEPDAAKKNILLLTKTSKQILILNSVSSISL